MPNVEYVTDQDLTDAVSSMLLSDDYPELESLRESGVVLLCCLRVKLNEHSESVPCKGEAVTVKKISPVERVFIQDKAQFVLVMDYHLWSNGSDAEKERALFTALQKITIERSKDGGLKLVCRKPDCVVWFPTLKRFGPSEGPEKAVFDFMLNTPSKNLGEIEENS